MQVPIWQLGLAWHFIAWKSKQHVYAATSGAQEEAVNFLKCMFFVIWSAAPHMYSTSLSTSLPFTHHINPLTTL